MSITSSARSIIRIAPSAISETIDLAALLDQHGLPQGQDAHSPLWMITSEPLLNQLVLDLQGLRLLLERAPEASWTLRCARGDLAALREAFERMIRHGEEQLHRLCQLLCATYLSSVQLQSVVIGAAERTGERFTLTQPLQPEELYTTTDLDLGTRQLRKLLFHDGTAWGGATLVANVVDYLPLEPNRLCIHRITSRIKAEEELWNKVVDEIFDIDSLVVRDKQLRHLSRYVKDVFGVKIVVGADEDVRRVHHALQQQLWTAEELADLDIAHSAETERLTIIEVKDYLAAGEQKRSGWAAIKLVARWCERTFEIQIQPLRSFLHERELLTQESHVGFKTQREQVRQQVARQVPLFSFYQQLLRWMVLAPDLPPPSYGNVIVALE